MRATVRMAVLTLFTPSNAAGALIVHVQLSCEGCGDQEFVLAGHHLKTLVEMLQRVIETADPVLVEEGEATTEWAKETIN